MKWRKIKTKESTRKKRKIMKQKRDENNESNCKLCMWDPFQQQQKRNIPSTKRFRILGKSIKSNKVFFPKKREEKILRKQRKKYSVWMDSRTYLKIELDVRRMPRDEANFESWWEFIQKWGTIKRFLTHTRTKNYFLYDKQIKS